MLVSLLSPAFALSCIWGVHATNIPDGASVPTNTQIVLAHTFEAGSELGVEVLDAQGTPVAGTFDVQDNHARFQPDALLIPGAYTIDDSNEGYLLSTFTVEDRIDETPPAAPTLVVVERQASNSEWGRSQGIHIEVEEDPDVGHYVYQIAADPSFTNPIEVIDPSPQTFVGRGLCEQTAPDYQSRERYHVRVGAVDVAGNRSEWTLSPVVARGCSSSAAGGSFLLLGLAGLLVRRRPR